MCMGVDHTVPVVRGVSLYVLPLQTHHSTFGLYLRFDCLLELQNKPYKLTADLHVGWFM